MSDSGNRAQLILDQLRASLDGTRYSASAIYAALIISFGGALAILSAVIASWRYLQDVYAPKPLLDLRLAHYSTFSDDSGSLDVPETASNSGHRLKLQTCIRDSWGATEIEIIDRAGLDAAIYLRALRMMRNIFAAMTVLLFGCIAPINIVYNLRSRLAANLTHKDVLLLLTPSLLSGKQLIPHVVLGWASNVLVLSVIWVNCKRVLGLRKYVLEKPNNSSVSRSILLMNLPKPARSEFGVKVALMRSIELSIGCVEPTEVNMGKKPSPELQQLIKQYTTNLREFERHPDCKDTFVGLVSLAHQIDAERTSVMESTGDNVQSFGFAHFDTGYQARTVYRRVLENDAKDVCLAPPPDQLIWPNLYLSSIERNTKQVWITILFGVLLLIWVIPNALIGCFLSNLGRLATVWPAFGSAMQHHPIGFAILQGFLAPTITTAIFATLPLLFRRMSHMQGKLTRLDREHEVLRKLYAFFFLDNFFLISIIGVIWDVIAQVIQISNTARAQGSNLSFSQVWHSLRVAERIATAIVNISSFWVMYLVRAVIAEFGRSSQPLKLYSRAKVSIQRKVWVGTGPLPREKAEQSMPQPFQYAVQYLSILFTGTIALGYTSIQPLVLPIAFVVFMLALPLKKYQLLQMGVTKYESNGLYWPLVCDIVLFSVGFGNLMLLCVTWVQGGWKVAIAAAPLSLMTILFKVALIFYFDMKFHFPEPDSDVEMVQWYSSSVTTATPISKRYQDPLLTAPLERPLLTFKDALCTMTGVRSNRLDYDHISERYRADIDKDSLTTFDCSDADDDETHNLGHIKKTLETSRAW